MVLVSHDAGLLAHWQRALGKSNQTSADSFAKLLQLALVSPAVVWVDMSLPDLPAWGDQGWQSLLNTGTVKIVAASSSPNDSEGVAALDAGCAAYCHAFSDAATLKQVKEVVRAGHVWIGKNLMQRILKNLNRVASLAPVPGEDWSEGLTLRQREVAILAANGAANRLIALDCKISERTVKAHLGAAFEKLNITDRLQLALRVHGIQ